MKIMPLFPTPVAIEKMERGLSEEEYTCISDHLNSVTGNKGSLRSNSTKVLDHPKLELFKADLEDRINTYAKTVLGLGETSNIEFYITGSWVNLTLTGGNHKEHNHPNSLFSGIYYFDVDPNHTIVFHDRYNHWSKFGGMFDWGEGDNELVNEFNSWIYNQHVSNDTLILFPSQLPHQVPTNEIEVKRASLAFNVWMRGEISKDIDYLKV